LEYGLERFLGLPIGADPEGEEEHRDEEKEPGVVSHHVIGHLDLRLFARLLITELNRLMQIPHG
jgi:hypothetical protein